MLNSLKRMPFPVAVAALLAVAVACSASGEQAVEPPSEAEGGEAGGCGASAR